MPPIEHHQSIVFEVCKEAPRKKKGAGFIGTVCILLLPNRKEDMEIVTTKTTRQAGRGVHSRAILSRDECPYL